MIPAIAAVAASALTFKFIKKRLRRNKALECITDADKEAIYQLIKEEKSLGKIASVYGIYRRDVIDIYNKQLTGELAQKYERKQLREPD